MMYRWLGGVRTACPPPATGKSISISLSLRSCVRARRSCACAWGRWVLIARAKITKFAFDSALGFGVFLLTGTPKIHNFIILLGFVCCFCCYLHGFIMQVFKKHCFFIKYEKRPSKTHHKINFLYKNISFYISLLMSVFKNSCFYIKYEKRPSKTHHKINFSV